MVHQPLPQQQQQYVHEGQQQHQRQQQHQPQQQGGIRKVHFACGLGPAPLGRTNNIIIVAMQRQQQGKENGKNKRQENRGSLKCMSEWCSSCCSF